MEKPEFVYVTYIHSTAQKVWEALTTPGITRNYWGGIYNKSDDWAKGSRWEHINEKDSEPLYIFGEVLESSPYTRLVLSWIDPDDTTDKSVVTYELEPFDDMVRLKVIHGNFKDGARMINSITKGWPIVLSSLKSYLETGKPIDLWKANKK